MFAYCENNPVNRSDATGQSWIIVGIVAVLLGVLMIPSSSETLPEKSYETMEEVAVAWAETYSQKTIEEHKEYGAVILSKKIDGKTRYYIGKTRKGFEGTCWNGLVLGYVFHTGKVEGFIHSHTAYPNGDGTWDNTDYGPSDADIWLFNLPGINRQFIANEQKQCYEFDEDGNQIYIY